MTKFYYGNMPVSVSVSVTIEGEVETFVPDVAYSDDGEGGVDYVNYDWEDVEDAVMEAIRLPKLPEGWVVTNISIDGQDVSPTKY